MVVRSSQTPCAKIAQLIQLRRYERDVNAFRHVTSLNKEGDMAQLVARFHGMEEVRGSIPLISTNIFHLIENRTKEESHHGAQH